MNTCMLLIAFVFFSVFNVSFLFLNISLFSKITLSISLEIALDVFYFSVSTLKVIVVEK